MTDVEFIEVYFHILIKSITMQNITRAFALFNLCLFIHFFSFAQTGRVVINEFMNWPTNSCGTASEYVELYNIGPGAVNIGCYILTDGDFSVTIPAGTVLQAGQYYIISGQNTIAAGCADDVITVTVNLNWATCGCTSGTIPTANNTDGFFTDGGNANEPIVLLTPAGQVADAVARSLPTETASNITSSTVGGTCTAITFDLDLITINYETIGVSGGRGNSFSRNIDGECGWGKETQQNGGETNNTGTDAPLWTLSVLTTGESNCGVSADGSAIISVTQPGGAVFPMNYTLGFDANNNTVFETTDTYTTGTDNTSPAINLNGLTNGRYRVTISDNTGCYYQGLNFTIACGPLPLRINNFYAVKQAAQNCLYWQTESVLDVAALAVEKSKNGTDFYTITDEGIHPSFLTNENNSYCDKDLTEVVSYYRLRFTEHNGRIHYSAVERISNKKDSEFKLYPNPAHDKLFLSTGNGSSAAAEVRIYDMNGRLQLSKRLTSSFVNITLLAKGIYYAEVEERGVLLRKTFVKQ
jgi:Lamin Tail Domain/Secretion system C-terminal sorting domain